MVMEAAAKWDIDLAHSLLIGDSPSDKELALTCGMPFIAVDEGTIRAVSASHFLSITCKFTGVRAQNIK
jgi:phosphoglycolate phosphatase-like HAD superfamily hydrolase